MLNNCRATLNRDVCIIEIKVIGFGYAGKDINTGFQQAHTNEIYLFCNFAYNIHGGARERR